jgi:hypothetical protein
MRAKGKGAHAQDDREPALPIRMGSPIFLTKSGQEPLPAIYVTLGMIFRALAAEYDDQAIDMTRFHTIMMILQDPLLNLRRTEGGPAEVVLERLNAVLGAFHRLRVEHMT